MLWVHVLVPYLSQGPDAGGPVREDRKARQARLKEEKKAAAAAARPGFRAVKRQ